MSGIGGDSTLVGVGSVGALSGVLTVIDVGSLFAFGCFRKFAGLNTFACVGTVFSVDLVTDVSTFPFFSFCVNHVDDNDDDDGIIGGDGSDGALVGVSVDCALGGVGTVTDVGILLALGGFGTFSCLSTVTGVVFVAGVGTFLFFRF